MIERWGGDSSHASTIALGTITAMQGVQGALNTHFNNVATTLGS